MYIVKCKILKLDSFVTFKRFYNPPTKKTWSKQNPLFKTPRPLVEPYNLGRLHPDREWWNLPKKGLKPDTFMGFPDVANITKHGGSLYAHFMDGPTLSMVVYRCIEKNITDIDIWNKLTAQSLKLSVSLDPYLLSILYLYFSLSCHYDYKFVSTFVGRILATLDQFGLEECANVISAMNNPQFYHEKTFNYIMKHSENLCLIRNLQVDECFRFLSCLKNVENPPQNCLIPIGELIEVSDLSIVNKMVLFDALDSCCKLNDKISGLCVTKLFHEACNVLESLKEFSHYFSLVFLNVVLTYKFNNDQLLHTLVTRINDNIHEATLEEQCRYLYLLSKLVLNDNRLMSPLSNTNLTTTVNEIVGVFKREVMKSCDGLVKNHALSFQVVVGLLNTNKNLNSHEMKLVESFVDKLSGLKREEVLELYKSVSNSRVELEYLEQVKALVVKAAWKLEPMDLPLATSLLDCDELDHLSIIPKNRLDECFKLLSDQIATLNSLQMTQLIKLATRHSNYANELIPRLTEHKRYLYKANIIVGLIDLYKACKRQPDEFIYELLDGLCVRRDHMLSEDKLKLMLTLKDNGINHYSVR